MVRFFKHLITLFIAFTVLTATTIMPVSASVQQKNERSVSAIVGGVLSTGGLMALGSTLASAGVIIGSAVMLEHIGSVFVEKLISKGLESAFSVTGDTVSFGLSKEVVNLLDTTVFELPKETIDWETSVPVSNVDGMLSTSVLLNEYGTDGLPKTYTFNYVMPAQTTVYPYYSTSVKAFVHPEGNFSSGRSILRTELCHGMPTHVDKFEVSRGRSRWYVSNLTHPIDVEMAWGGSSIYFGGMKNFVSDKPVGGGSISVPHTWTIPYDSSVTSGYKPDILNKFPTDSVVTAPNTSIPLPDVSIDYPISKPSDIPDVVLPENPAIPDVGNPSLPNTGIEALDKALEFIGSAISSVTDTIKDIFTPSADVNINFEPLYMSFADKFPFSIPFDVHRIISEFKTVNTEPIFYVDMSGFDSAKVTKGNVGFELDFTKFESLFAIARIFILISFSVFLAIKTRDIIKG